MSDGYDKEGYYCLAFFRPYNHRYVNLKKNTFCCQILTVIRLLTEINFRLTFNFKMKENIDIISVNSHKIKEFHQSTQGKPEYKIITRPISQ